MTQYIAEINAVGLTTSKARGEAAEAAFLAKVTSLGFGVSKTWGDSERYDFILDSGQKLWRVQVKSSRHSDGSRYIVKLKGAAAYTAEEIDFIVAYIIPENLWYVIPISVAALRGQMYVSPGGARHFRHEKYREAWCPDGLSSRRNLPHPAPAQTPAQLFFGRVPGRGKLSRKVSTITRRATFYG